jgi:Domain of Unknown Function with PDB structure (DUF3857)/Transglutaminase-like superfamily
VSILHPKILFRNNLFLKTFTGKLIIKLVISNVMLRQIIVFLFGFLVFGASAQKSPVKFGEIPMEDMSMKFYAKDSTASAVILLDYGKAYVNNLYHSYLIYERHVRIKILNKNGFKWGDVAILLYGSYTGEKVNDLKAITYNLEGGSIVQTKLSKEGVFKEKFNRSFDWQKFTFPNVREGSILEYSYTIESPYFANFPNWKFQYTIPVRHSEFWAMIPDFFIMERYMQGYLVPTDYTVETRASINFSEEANKWLMIDVPAFREEPYMTSEDDYVSKINFALAYVHFPNQSKREVMGSWQKLNTGLIENESFGVLIDGSVYLKKQVEEIVGVETDPKKKAEKIYKYVQETLEWDQQKDFLAERPKETFEKKKGSSADINIALASMLEKAGLEVDMVLISTRDHGFVREQYPMTRQFNYTVCIVRIDGKPFFLDATEKYLPFGALPERCLNGKGLIISKKSHGWIKLETEIKDRSITQGDLKLNPNGELVGTVTFSHFGFDAVKVRKGYKQNGEADYVRKGIGNNSNWQISKSTFENFEDLGKPMKEIHELAIQDHSSSSRDIMYINPFVVGQTQNNPFKVEDRLYPVDYGSFKEFIYMCKIKLPEEYVVVELPKSKIFVMPENAARYTYNVYQVGDIISIMSNFQINRAIFIQSEYLYLREFYNQVIAKEAEQIVLKRK